MPSGTPPAEIEEVTNVNGPESASDLPRRAARVLGERLGGELEAPVGERGSLVLRLARDVAHAGERASRLRSPHTWWVAPWSSAGGYGHERG